MHGYVAHIEDLTDKNSDFRQVLYTGQHLQLVLMALKPGQDIGSETHATHDQFFRIEKGHGKIVIDGATTPIKGGDAIIVPAGALHNLKNTGDKPLRLYTLYGPPNHIDHLVQAKKSEATASHEVFDGVATEPTTPHLVTTQP
jgi:mannose-6-phosphate isomerase-like protein (cupin superfamily)